MDFDSVILKFLNLFFTQPSLRKLICLCADSRIEKASCVTLCFVEVLLVNNKFMLKYRKLCSSLFRNCTVTLSLFCNNKFMLKCIQCCCFQFQVVFLTALFYLLSSSGSQYKVVEWISGVSMGTRFSESINIAVTDVFGATLKMATFYGFYTWVTHSLFSLNIVFIPSGKES